MMGIVRAAQTFCCMVCSVSDNAACECFLSTLLGIYLTSAHHRTCMCVGVAVSLSGPRLSLSRTNGTDSCLHRILPIEHRINALYAEEDKHHRAAALFQITQLHHQLGLLAACSIVWGNKARKTIDEVAGTFVLTS